MKATTYLLFVCGFQAVSPSLALAQDNTQQLAQALLAVKASVVANRAALGQYYWTEHTEILQKNSVKKTMDNHCRYGSDGKVVKAPIGTPAPPKEMRAMKKKVTENKREELADYMERSISLVHQYLPPSIEQLQANFEAGTASIQQTRPGTAELRCKDYWKSGDLLLVTLNSQDLSIQKIGVFSYLGEPKDKVTLDVAFQQLPDGTTYPSQIILNAPEKKIQVRVTNSNYQKLAR